MVSVRDFHSSFLLYCVRNKFASLMYHYLDYYRYTFEGGEGGREGGKEGGREGVKEAGWRECGVSKRLPLIISALLREE